MKKSQQLKWLLSAFFIALVLSSIVSSLFVIKYTIFKGQALTSLDRSTSPGELWMSISWSSYSLIFSMFLAYGIFQLRKASLSFETTQYFSDSVISPIRKAGNSFLLLGGILVIFHLITYFFVSSIYFLVIDTILYCYAFIFVIGIFFRFFGDAFTEGKALQEENELTI